MPTSFQELVESQDWEEVRNSIKLQCDLKRLALSIKEVLDANEKIKGNETPPDILPCLFEKLRPLRDKSICFDKKNSWYRKCRFAEQLFAKVCCFETIKVFRTSPQMKYAPHILATLLEEHKRVYKREKYPDDTLTYFRALVCQKWIDRLSGPNMQDDWTTSRRPGSNVVNVVPEEKEDELLSIQSLDDLKKSKDLFALWKITEMLGIHAKSDENTPLLHTLLTDQYPLVVAWLAAKIYPDQLYQRDCAGRIPLHYAAKESITFSASGYTMEFSASFCEAARWGDPKGKSCVKLLTELIPKGAKYADNDGKLPLAAYFELSSHAGEPNFEDVSLLINAEPRALLTRDMETHLLPFMIPAQRSNSDYNHDACGTTSLIYQILRENPAAVAIGITGKSNDSIRVTRLNKKVATVEAERADLKAKNNELVNELANTKNKAESLIAKQNEEIKRLRQLLDGKFSSEDSDNPTKRARLE